MRAATSQMFTDTSVSWMDRFNGVWTPVFLVILGVIAFTMPFITTPAACWAPQQMTTSMVAYINKRCWQNNVLVYKSTEPRVIGTQNIKSFVADPSSGVSGVRTLYQWFPYILVFQALFFAIPYVLWVTLASASGMNINKVHGMVKDYSELSAQDKKHVAQQLARYLNQWLEASPLKGIPWGLLTFITIFIKILFLVNISTQYALFDGFLKAGNESSYGTQLLRNLNNEVNGTVWRESPAFPISLLCNFEIQMLTAPSIYTVECHFGINMYYEMISAFVWLWLCFTLIVTVTSCVFYGLHIIIPVFRTRFVKRHLLASPNLSGQPTENDISRFAGSTLGQDGVTVLRWISMVSSDLLVVDTIEHLWQLHHGGVDAPTMAPTHSLAQSNPVSQPPPSTETLSSYYGVNPQGNENIPLVTKPSAPSMYPKTT